MRVQADLRRWRHDRGYAMVALLVAMSVMAVMMSIALPVWTTAARREKEAELVFRGEQYARAIALFQRKYANAIPPSVDALIDQKFLRKKYKDPITGEDFQLLTPGAPIPGQQGAAQPGARGAGARVGEAQRQIDEARRAGAANRPGGTQTGSLIGVVSKSTEQSLRVYNGRDKYNEWVFLGTQQSNRAGGVTGGAPGGRGGAAPGVPGRGGPAGRGGRLTLPPTGGRGGTTFPPAPGGRQVMPAP